jgi:hypothetical protein
MARSTLGGSFPRQIGSFVPERPSGRLVGGLSAGLLLGMLGGWLAGLLRAPRLPRVQRP